MDYEKFKQDMEQDALKNLANRGIEAETDVQHIMSDTDASSMRQPILDRSRTWRSWWQPSEAVRLVHAYSCR
jgi:hypothetical protein